MEEPLPTVPAPDPAGPRGPTDWSRVEAPGGKPRSGFGVGAIVGRTFRIWWRELPRFGLIGLASAVAPAWATYQLYRSSPELLIQDPSAPPGESLGRIYGRFGGLWFLSYVLWSIHLGAIAHGAVRRLRGGRAGLGELLGAGLQRSFAMFGVVVIGTLAVAFTFCTLVVPLLLGACWAGSIAAVAEGAGPIRALGRSWELTLGYRWQVLAAMLLVLLAYLVAVSVLQVVVTGGAFGWWGGAAVPPEQALVAQAIPFAVAQLAAGIVGTLLPVASAVVHHGLCLVKEGGDPVHLSQVFE